MKRQYIIHWSLFGLGVIAWAGTGMSLKEKGEFDCEPNILTLKGSPFGRTVAVAMRGPVDVYWNQGEAHSHEDGHSCSKAGCLHQDCKSSESLAHQGGERESGDATIEGLLDGMRGHAEQEVPLPAKDSFLTGILNRIDDWKAVYYSRTNPFGSSEVHKIYIMGETEKRLRLSYEMDPSNFAAYGSYFLFRSEALSQLKTEEQGPEIVQQAIDSALGLAGHTIHYCLGRRDEPGALLTAAAAAHDYLQMSYQRNQEERAELFQFLQLQGECLREYAALKESMVANGTWERFPAIRQQEMEMHELLLRRLYEGNMQMVGGESAEESNQTVENLQSS